MPLDESIVLRFIDHICPRTRGQTADLQTIDSESIPQEFHLRVVLTRPPPLRDSVAGRKCSMPSASHRPGGCRPPAGDVSRWLLVRGCRMRTLTCSVFKGRRESERSAAHSFSANYAALFRGRLIYPFIFIGIEKGFFIEPF